MPGEEPPSLALTGVLLRSAGRPDGVFIAGAGRTAAVPGDILYTGKMVFRCAAPLLHEEDYLLPRYACDDFRRLYDGEAVIHFLLDKAARFPRGDVAGTRVSDGREVELFVKQVDIAGGLLLLAFPERAARPLAEVRELIWLEGDRGGLEPLPEDDRRCPAYLRRIVRCWRAGRHEIPNLAAMLHPG